MASEQETKGRGSRAEFRRESGTRYGELMNGYKSIPA